MSKPVHHVLDIYDTNLHAAYDLKAWRILRRSYDFLDKKPDSAGSCSSALFVPNKPGVAVFHVALFIDAAGHQHESHPTLVNTCAHEATHAAIRILEHAGQPIVDDEAIAYLVGWITGWLIHEMPQ